MQASSIPWQQDLKATARVALACLDLTSLNDADTEADIARLCARAQGPFGAVAAVCVWPRLAAFARAQLPASIAVAAVANFPHGSADVQQAVRDTGTIVQSGAQEVDVVLPYRQLMAGDDSAVTALLVAVRKACEGLRLKVILETGVLQDDALIQRACRLSLDAGADFLKTSTGKTPVSATPQAARTLLAAIAADLRYSARVGFKPSGGIRTLADARSYLDLADAIMGPDWASPTTFRFGASGLYGALVAAIDGAGPDAAPRGSY